MKLPSQAPGAYAAAFGMWGITTGEYGWAIAAALVFELPRLLGKCMDVDLRGFRTAWVLSIFLFWALGLTSWMQLNRIEALYSVLKWLPIALLPAALASAVAQHPAVPMTALHGIIRRRYLRSSAGGVPPPIPSFDPFFPYLWVVLLSASHASPQSWFFWASAALAAWVFLHTSARAYRRHMIGWLFLVGVCGFAGHRTFLYLYHLADQALYSSLQLDLERESSRSITRLGSIGKLKNSPAIRWRLQQKSGRRPEYLQEASFNTCVASAWINNGQRFFVPVTSEIHVDRRADWRIFEADIEASSRASLLGRVDYNLTVLPLAPGTHRIEGLDAGRVERNGMGVVRADMYGGLVQCDMVSMESLVTEHPPDMATDLSVPAALKPILRELTEELELSYLPPEKQAEAIRQFLLFNFQYSLDQDGASIARFLTDDRRGHCQYFATATALLLRSVGIPARYNTGFAVEEFDQGSGQWLMRGTHAHAWASAWIGGRWVIVDSTPPDWLQADSADHPFWQGLADWWDEKRIAFEIWRENSAPGDRIATFSRAGIVLVVIYALVRFWMGQRKKKRVPAARSRGGPCYEDPEVNSHWSRLLPEVEQALGARPDWLPTALWVESFNTRAQFPAAAAHILVDDHNLRRFGKAQSGSREKPVSEALDRAVDELKKHLASTS